MILYSAHKLSRTYCLASHSLAYRTAQDTMPERAQRPPKLRASCDRCGLSKLKCDRQHPSCGRCQILELDCVYGISRKSSRKPVRVDPRELPRPTTGNSQLGLSANGTSSSMPISGSSRQHHYAESQSSRASIASELSMEHNLMFDQSGAHMPNAFPEGDLNTLEQFGSMDIDDWDFTDAMEANIMESLPTPIIELPQQRGVASQPQLDRPTHAAQQPHSVSAAHDCHREACTVFGSLSFLDLDQKQTQDSASAAALALLTNHVPLDHVLNINRNACERLIHLLNCSCARSPHLALLYTSIFARVLIWYQQAVGCAQPGPWSSIPTNEATLPQSTSAATSASTSASASESSSRSDSADSLWTTGCLSAGSFSPRMSSIPAYKRAPSMPALAQAVAPMQIAMGSFHIDDQDVQKSLNIQLVSSEMKRAAAVIDAFASQSSSGHSSQDACSFGGVDSLYKSLSAWLRGEHARTTGIIQSKLNDLNDDNAAGSRT